MIAKEKNNSNIRYMFLGALLLCCLFILTACHRPAQYRVQGNVVSVHLVYYDNPQMRTTTRSEYLEFDFQLVEVIEELEEEQLEYLLAAIDGIHGTNHRVQYNSPDGLLILVKYDTGDFDVVSNQFTAHYDKEGNVSSYVGGSFSVRPIMAEYFSSDLTRFYGRFPVTAEQFTIILQEEGFDVIDYTEDYSESPNIRQRLRGYFPYTHSEYGNAIEFTSYMSPQAAQRAFNRRRAEVQESYGHNQITTEERMANWNMTSVYYQSRFSRVETGSNERGFDRVIIHVTHVNSLYSEQMNSLFEQLFLAVDTEEVEYDGVDSED